MVNLPAFLCTMNFPESIFPNPAEPKSKKKSHAQPFLNWQKHAIDKRNTCHDESRIAASAKN